MQESLFKYRALFHIAGWVIFFIIPLLLFPTHEFTTALSDRTNILSLFIRNLLWMALFYANLFYLTPGFLNKKESGLFIMTLIVAIIVIAMLNSGVHHFFSALLNDTQKGPPGDFGFPSPPAGGPPGGGPPGGGPPDANVPPFGAVPGRRSPFDFRPRGPFFFSNIVISLMVASVSTSLVLWENWSQAKRDEKERAFQKVASELAVLKLQISPHFLFNTLNNIRWLIRSGSDQAENAVVKLSHLLRYVLYQTGFEKVELEREAEHLRDYTGLQQMRLVNKESVALTVSGVEPNQTIVPLLLIPLVENVFKYGDFGGPFQNQIKLTVENNVLKFKTVNKISEGSTEKKDNEYGIGLDNVRKRLAMHYPDRHSLQSAESDKIYTLELEIIL